MDQPLFAARSIEDVRRSYREAVLRALAEITEVAEVDDSETADRLQEKGRIELPELSRADATFETEERGQNLHVTVSIPVTSGWGLLSVRPATAASVVPRGYVESSLRFLSDGHPLLKMTESFPRTATSGDIKAWAAGQADRVQEYIEFLRPDIEVHNSDLGKMVQEGLERRRRELEALGGLRGNLEGGI